MSLSENFDYKRQPDKSETVLQIILILSLIFHYFFDRTIQNRTKYINGVSADAFIPFQTGDLGRADMILMDQGILRDSFSSHGFPKPDIRNHIIPSLHQICIDIITENGLY